MDKATAEELLTKYRQACYWFKDSCRFGDEKEQEKFGSEMDIAGANIIEALTRPPVVTDTKPQGEATAVSNCVESDWAFWLEGCDITEKKHDGTHPAFVQWETEGYPQNFPRWLCRTISAQIREHLSYPITAARVPPAASPYGYPEMIYLDANTKRWFVAGEHDEYGLIDNRYQPYKIHGPLPESISKQDDPLFNRYGVDADYFRRELQKLAESLENRPADELARYLRNLADTAKPADPLHDKILAIKDNMESAFNSVEHLLEPDKNELLEATPSKQDDPLHEDQKKAAQILSDFMLEAFRENKQGVEKIKEAHKAMALLVNPYFPIRCDSLDMIHSMAIQCNIRGAMLDPKLVIEAIEAQEKE